MATMLYSVEHLLFQIANDKPWDSCMGFQQSIARFPPDDRKLLWAVVEDGTYIPKSVNREEHLQRTTTAWDLSRFFSEKLKVTSVNECVQVCALLRHRTNTRQLDTEDEKIVPIYLKACELFFKGKLPPVYNAFSLSFKIHQKECQIHDAQINAAKAKQELEQWNAKAQEYRKELQILTAQAK